MCAAYSETISPAASEDAAPGAAGLRLQAQQVVRDLFAAYRAHPVEMQAGFATRADRPRAVADYIAGMTDRFAAKEHARLTGQRLLDSAAT